jgi:hypothetical protein
MDAGIGAAGHGNRHLRLPQNHAKRPLDLLLNRPLSGLPRPAGEAPAVVLQQEA